MARPEKTWENEPSEDTPLNAAGLNDLEDRHFTYVEQRANHTIGAQLVADETQLGALTHMVEVFNAAGVSVGYMPIYDGQVGSGGGGGTAPGTLLFESTFPSFPDTWSWSYVQANADGDMSYPTSTVESSWQGATNVAKFETTTAGLALSPARKHAKVYKGFVFPGGSFDPGTPSEVALIDGVYRARFWLPLTYSVPAGNVGSNIFQFKEKMTDDSQNPHTWCYTWDAADVGLNPSLGPALYVNNGVTNWSTSRRTQLPLGSWFELKVVVLRGDSLKWYLNDALFATVPSAEKTIGVATNLEEWIWGVGNYVETVPNVVYIDRAWKMTT